MSSRLQQALSDLPMAMRCRPAGPDDMGFLLDTFAITREHDLGLQGIDPGLREALVDMQFKAQQGHYTQAYPGCKPWVIEQSGRKLGQMWLFLDSRPDDPGLRLMDLAVLPAYRHQGVATACLQALLRLTEHLGWPMHLHVLANNPIRHWYERMGFALTHEAGLYLGMTHQAIKQESFCEQA